MNETLQQIISKSKDSVAVVDELRKAGLSIVTGKIGQLPLLHALTAGQSEGQAYDETHYLLVPAVEADCGYALFTKRLIPAGEGANNSLPKRRVFHVPNESTCEVLVDLLTLEKRGEIQARKSSTGFELADRLDHLAEGIDKEAGNLSGGLLLIGGAVAFFNPLLGIGIALNSIVPAVGSKIAQSGTSLVADKLRDWNAKTHRAEIDKKAKQEVKRLKADVYENPILKSIDALLSNVEPEYDPFVSLGNPVDHFSELARLAITSEAVRSVYGKTDLPESIFTQWVSHVGELDVGAGTV